MQKRDDNYILRRCEQSLHISDFPMAVQHLDHINTYESGTEHLLGLQILYNSVCPYVNVSVYMSQNQGISVD